MGLMRAALIAVILVGMLPSAASASAPGQVRLEDLNGRRIDPFEAAPGTKAIVFIFSSVDCPISNRYAPDVQRLHRRFAPEGVQFWLVYPNPADSPDIITRHVRDFSYPMRALRDPQHQLVKLIGATVTPEVAIYHPAGRMIYRGRIDDRYVSLGVERPAAMRRDLEEALSATLAGKAVSEPVTQAVGCFIADFVPGLLP
jgi:hypothetical protein